MNTTQLALFFLITFAPIWGLITTVLLATFVKAGQAKWTILVVNPLLFFSLMLSTGVLAYEENTLYSAMFFIYLFGVSVYYPLIIAILLIKLVKKLTYRPPEEDIRDTY